MEILGAVVSKHFPSLSLGFREHSCPEANMRNDKIDSTSCWICGGDVPSKNCKVGEHGRTVHEVCRWPGMKLESESSRVPRERHE